jgi:hypothetical protein
MCMKKIIIILPVFLLYVFLFTSCEKEESGKGTVKLSITDAPIDADGIEGVFITVTGVHYNKSGDNWEEFVFDEPQVYNLLDLQRGDSEMMGSFELEAGTYTQIRFMLDAPVSDAGPLSNPGCYLKMEDGTIINLFVPSGAQTGYKAIGNFDVPVNGSVEITADFDVRKSVVKAGASGKYLLKPAIRLIVTNQSGQIAGQVNNIPEGTGVVIYVYENGSYEGTEAETPADGESRFPGAVTSDQVDDSNAYYLAYLAPGLYDLVIVSTVEGEFTDVVGLIEGIEVKSEETTNLPVDINQL